MKLGPPLSPGAPAIPEEACTRIDENAHRTSQAEQVNQAALLPHAARRLPVRPTRLH
jgi:hypothetical protein